MYIYVYRYELYSLKVILIIYDDSRIVYFTRTRHFREKPFFFFGLGGKIIKSSEISYNTIHRTIPNKSRFTRSAIRFFFCIPPQIFPRTPRGTRVTRVTTGRVTRRHKRLNVVLRKGVLGPA